MAIVDIPSFLIHTEYYYTRDCGYCNTVVFSSLPVVRLINNALFGWVISDQGKSYRKVELIQIRACQLIPR